MKEEYMIFLGRSIHELIDIVNTYSNVECQDSVISSVSPVYKRTPYVGLIVTYRKKLVGGSYDEFYS